MGSCSPNGDRHGKHAHGIGTFPESLRRSIVEIAKLVFANHREQEIQRHERLCRQQGKERID